MDQNEGRKAMGVGVLFIIFGIGAWVLPLLGFQFKFISFFTDILGLPIEAVSVVSVVVGAIFLYFGKMAGSDKNSAKSPLASPAPKA